MRWLSNHRQSFQREKNLQDKKKFLKAYKMLDTDFKKAVKILNKLGWTVECFDFENH